MLIEWLVVPATAATLRVPQDYPTIQDAVNAASPGDTIEVAAGTYFENVIVNTTVTIVGENSTATIVDGGGNNVVFDIQANNVELRNLTIRNGGRRYIGVTLFDPYDGLTVRNTRIMNNVVGVAISEADGNTIEDSIFINNSMYGIDVKYSSGNIIRNNKVSESAYGIEISDTLSSQVVNNTVSDTSYGIYVPYSNNINISANTLSSNSWNIYLTHSNSNIVENNVASGGSVGIQLMTSQGNSVANNTVSSSSYGIYLGYCGANTVSGNTASLNDWGIELYNSSGSTIKENIVKDNTWGFYVAENSKGNYIYHNNIINNVKQAYQDPTSGQNTWRTPTTPYEGNYWSDYIGQDTNGDGIGDTYLPWQGVDWYPLMEPWGAYSDVAIIDATVSDTKVYVGEIVNITVVAENQGTWTETFNVTVKYENTTLAISGTVGTQEVVDLAPDANVTLVFSWNTTEMQPCVNYTIIAEASILPGELDTEDNTHVDGKVKVKMPGDVNGDGVVDVMDLSIIGAAYGTFEGQPGYDPDADLNEDGIVDLRDLAVVTINYGNTCP
jgi:nitrous oxidase accessory protein